MFHKECDKCGNITLKIDTQRSSFFLHSKYDVQREATSFAMSNKDKLNENNVVYGFGLGYHIKALLDIMNENQKLYVFDIRDDICDFAINNINLENIIKDKRLEIYIDKNETKLATKMGEALKLENVSFFAHKPSIKAIDDNSKLKNILELMDINKALQIDQFQIQNIKKNVEQNKKLDDENISKYFGKYKNKPGFVISAGPSLDYALDYLKDFEHKAILFSVGRCLKSLLNKNIKPHYFSIIDPNPITLKQIEGVENLDIPLVYLNSAYYETIQSYNGKRYVCYNDDIYGEDNTIETGGSVATAVLDILIRFGCNPIIFVGQDLGFTKDKHHSKDSIFDGDNKTNVQKNMRTVKSVDGNEIYTTLGLLSFKHFIEKKIKDNPQIKFYNCSKGGANIEGTEYIDIKNLI